VDNVAGVNAITMAPLHESPEILDELLPWNGQREGFSRRGLSMKDLARMRNCLKALA
jgi:hypothetical protein